MEYEVRYLEHQRETGREPTSSYEAAKALVEDFVVHDPNYSAEVIDSGRKCVFRLPRAVRVG